MNEAYWREYYAKPHTTVPSPFAFWALNNGLRGRTVIDFGCGNGRDTRFLRCANRVAGVDLNAPDGECFHRTSIEEWLDRKPVAEVAYCRFLFHAIGPELQQRIIDWVWGSKALLYAEMRSVLDSPHADPERPAHERRLIDGQRLLSQLTDSGFYILHYQEGRGLAPFGDEDPYIIRLVVRGSGMTA